MAVRRRWCRGPSPAPVAANRRLSREAAAQGRHRRLQGRTAEVATRGDPAASTPSRTSNAVALRSAPRLGQGGVAEQPQPPGSGRPRPRPAAPAGPGRAAPRARPDGGSGRRPGRPSASGASTTSVPADAGQPGRPGSAGGWRPPGPPRPGDRAPSGSSRCCPSTASAPPPRPPPRYLLGSGRGPRPDYPTSRSSRPPRPLRPSPASAPAQWRGRREAVGSDGGEEGGRRGTRSARTRSTPRPSGRRPRGPPAPQCGGPGRRCPTDGRGREQVGTQAPPTVSSRPLSAGRGLGRVRDHRPLQVRRRASRRSRPPAASSGWSRPGLGRAAGPGRRRARAAGGGRRPGSAAGSRPCPVWPPTGRPSTNVSPPAHLAGGDPGRVDRHPAGRGRHLQRTAVALEGADPDPASLRGVALQSDECAGSAERRPSCSSQGPTRRKPGVDRLTFDSSLAGSGILAMSVSGNVATALLRGWCG